MLIIQCLSAETCLKSFFIHQVKHPQEIFTIQCSSSVTCLKCFFVYTGSNTPSSLTLSNVSIMQHASGFFIPSGHHIKYFITIQCFRVTTCFQSLFFLPESKIPSGLSPSTFEFCEMARVLLVHPKSSTLNSLSLSSVSCWWQGSDISSCILGHTQSQHRSGCLSPLVSVFWHASSASSPSWVKHTSSLATSNVSVL